MKQVKITITYESGEPDSRNIVEQIRHLLQGSRIQGTVSATIIGRNSTRVVSEMLTHTSGMTMFDDLVGQRAPVCHKLPITEPTD